MQSNQPEYSILSDSMDLDLELDSDGGGGVPRKRRRLTHLSPDEKLMRRKLKNRVAAQTARDRKKALMTELEEKVAQLEEENKLLKRQNISLKESSTCLVRENAELRSRLSHPTLQASIKTETEPIRSAAPAVPLQKEQVQHLSRWMAQYCTAVMMMSLMVTAVCCKSLESSDTASSRKRKQSHPLRRVSVSEQNILVKQEPQEPGERPSQWWGSHQQSWNPSMN